jgi:2-methylcitrate dehydratase PrpD
MRYVVANALVHGSVRLDAFEPHRLEDRTTRALMERVDVVLDPELDATFPNQRAARVTIDTLDGRSTLFYQENRKGDPELPLSDDDLEVKFLELGAPVIGDREAKRLVAELWRLEHSADLAFTQAVRPHA